jgi:S1-C subfamily serine protease
MKLPSWPSLRRVLAGALVVLALMVALGGCSLPSFSGHASMSTTSLAGPGESWLTATTEPPRTVTTPSTTSTTSITLRPTTTTSTTLRPTTTTASTAVHAPTGDPKAIAKKLKASVVGITAVTASTATMIYESIGTGVIYSATTSYGYIVTNNHVIERDDGTAAKKIRVTLPSGSTVTATLIGRDPTTDIAVLRVKARKLTPAVFRTDLAELAHGDFVVAIGNTKVLKHPVTSGNVTAVLRNIDYPGLSGVHQVIESTAPLDHGNSGGPLVDVDALVVGINMAELLSGEGGISLPADLVVEVAERLIVAAK